MVHIQQGLVNIGEVEVVLSFVVLSESLVLRGWEFAERGKVCVNVSHVEAVRLVEITIPEREKLGRKGSTSVQTNPNNKLSLRTE